MKKIIFLISSILIIIILILCLILLTKKDNKYEKIRFEYVFDYYLDKDYKITNNEVLLNNYSSYRKFIDEYEIADKLEKNDFDNYNYLVVFDENSCQSEREVNNIKYYVKKNTLEINYNYHKICGLCLNHYVVYFIKIAKINHNNIKIKSKYNKIKGEICEPNVDYKPIIYLYPLEDTNISIKLEKDKNIITSYPEYNNGWNIFVKKNGVINYNEREFYALYWDEYNDSNIDFHEGFYVDSKNAIDFLEEKLDFIGLNNRESNEFIMYWLPLLEQNKHSLVYFELTDERENNNKLIINPKPDSLLRINMHIKKVYSKINIDEQQLNHFNRRGFTVVEWGGTIHKEDNNAR